MKFIKSVNSHGSEIILLVCKNNDESFIIKSSTTLNGIESINSERRGINWYNLRSKNKIFYKLKKENKTYQKIQIKFNKNFSHIEKSLTYIELVKYLDLVVDHYIEIWKKFKCKNFSPFHGDLSLVGNVLFNDNNVLFIDWEHFDEDCIMPTGLDIILMILENIYYESLKNKIIKPSIFNHIKILIERLNNSNLLSSKLQKNPAQNALYYLKKNIHIWKGQH